MVSSSESAVVDTSLTISGARAYYTHFVLHNWNDEECRKILRNLMPAMTPRYSKILLNEFILPDEDCPSQFAARDITMMVLLAAMERTETQWVELVRSVGLDVVRIWRSPYSKADEAVIEAMLPDSWGTQKPASLEGGLHHTSGLKLL